jgi:DNA polymerase III sliding clamp (beta) subunit (PCNA family)
VVGVTITCKTDEAFAVDGKTLLGLLSNSSGDEVEFITSDNDVVIKTGRSNFKLPYMEEGAFVFAGDKNRATFGHPIDEALIKGIQACLMTASRDATKAALWGVTVNRSKTIKFYSCDGDALTRYDTKTSNGAGPDIMLPIKFCEALVKIASTVGLGKQALLSVSKDWVRAQITDGYEVHGHLVENNNPLNHEDVITRVLKNKPKFFKVPEGFNEALTRAQVVTKNETARTVLTAEGGKLKLFTETQMGIVRDSVSLSDHPDVTADVNAELIQRSIAICDEIAITSRCVACQSGEALLQIISNMNK